MAKMKRSAKIWLIVATALTVIGLAMTFVAIAATGFDFVLLSTVEYETNSYEIGENFKDIFIITDTTDITVKPSDDGSCRVVCREESKLTHRVNVNGDALEIKAYSENEWYDHVGIGFESTSITIYLPEEAYRDLSIDVDTGDTEVSGSFSFENVSVKASTGDITLGKICAESIDLAVSTGRISVTDVDCLGELKHKCSTGASLLERVNCNSIESVGGTGDISLKDVIATGEMYVKRSTGDVTFDCSDAEQITVKTSTGEVCGSLLTEKNFSVSTSTGEVEIPESTVGGKCEITTSTGDVNIFIAK